ncbi:MAG: DUF2339 domain-containing protein [Elusimicrobiaceae bacterium]|nr:DUF2339 domain-containing protein [Elusimicrobiaceae bacterium]
MTFLLFVAVVYLIAKSARIGDAEREISSLKNRISQLERYISLLSGKFAPAVSKTSSETAVRQEASAVGPGSAPPAGAAPGSVPAPVLRPHAEPGPIPGALEPDMPGPAPAKTVDWENFAGASLFAWLGGFALFLGLVFFVKYSIDAGYLSPLVRVALGLAGGTALVTGGAYIKDRGVKITSDTLCASGIAVLYASVYAAGSFYGFIGQGPEFLFMAIVSASAFFLSVHMNAQFVAILGLAGGFLTPLLLSAGEARTLALFSYIGLLDIALLALAARMRWPALVWLSGLGTLALEFSWYGRFFSVEQVWPAAAVFALFPALYAAMSFLRDNLRLKDDFAGASAPALAIAGVLAAWNMAGFNGLAGRPAPAFTLLMLVNITLCALSWREAGFYEPWRKIVSLLNFVTLLRWTIYSVTPETLPLALFFFVLFSILGGIFPLYMRARGKTQITYADGLAATLCLLPLLPLIFKCGTGSWLVWPAVAVIAAAGLAVAAALGAASLAVGGFALVLIVMLFWLFKMPLAGGGIGLMIMAAVMAGVFMGVGAGLKKLSGALDMPPDNPLFKHFSLLSVLPSFMLMFVAVFYFKPLAPHAAFGAALAVAVLLLAAARVYTKGEAAYMALIGSFLVQLAWHSVMETGMEPAGIAWHCLFLAVFLAYPYIARGRFSQMPAVWITAALAGCAQFLLVYGACKPLVPPLARGFVPAAFAVLYLAVALFEARGRGGDGFSRSRLAWSGGMTLFFITLIFPVQFDREWLTIAWGLEGAALVWLYARLPHPGLKRAAYILLAASFARLALNGSVLTYHIRQDVPVFNWYLYTYGLVAAACFIGAKLWPENEGELFATRPSPVLSGMGVILLFLLLNIEIADYFSAGSALTFEFSGNLVRDMVYTLGWGLFALGLLVAGLYKRSRAGRLAAVALMSATVLKLFFHDLWVLGQLYRVGAFVGLAVLLIVVSYLYQRFVRGNHETSVP